MEDEIASIIPYSKEEKAEENSAEKRGLEKEVCLEKLKKFFKPQSLAVLATQNREVPYVSLVTFASDEKLTCLLFSNIFFFRLLGLRGSIQTCE